MILIVSVYIKDMKEIKVNLDIDINGLSNNQLAAYVNELDSAVSLSVKNAQYSMMSIYMTHKLRVQNLLEDRLKKAVKH
tara:strand:+ start:1978 stop:2214 length:237 start_codon:yes stop_codon:yes gene_type:complete